MSVATSDTSWNDLSSVKRLNMLNLQKMVSVKTETKMQVLERLNEEKRALLSELKTQDQTAVGESVTVLFNDELCQKHELFPMGRMSLHKGKYRYNAAPLGMGGPSEWDIPVPRFTCRLGEVSSNKVETFSDLKAYEFAKRKTEHDSFHFVETALFALFAKKKKQFILMNPSKGTLFRAVQYKPKIFFTPDYSPQVLSVDPSFALLEQVEEIGEEDIVYQGSNGPKYSGGKWVSFLANPYSNSFPFADMQRVTYDEKLVVNYVRKGYHVTAKLGLGGYKIVSPSIVRKMFGVRGDMFMCTNFLAPRVQHPVQGKYVLGYFEKMPPPMENGVSFDSKYVYDVEVTEPVPWSWKVQRIRDEAKVRGLRFPPLLRFGNCAVTLDGLILSPSEASVVTRFEGVELVHRMHPEPKIVTTSIDGPVQRVKVASVLTKGKEIDPFAHIKMRSGIMQGNSVVLDPAEIGLVFVARTRTDLFHLIEKFRLRQDSHRYIQEVNYKQKYVKSQVVDIVAKIEELSPEKFSDIGVQASVIAHDFQMSTDAVVQASMMSRQVIVKRYEGVPYVKAISSITETLLQEDGTRAGISDLLAQLQSGQEISLHYGHHFMLRQVLEAMYMEYADYDCGGYVRFRIPRLYNERGEEADIIYKPV